MESKLIFEEDQVKIKMGPGKSNWKGCLSTVDLRVLTSLNQLLLIC
jgi:hypothetical protein